VKFHRLRDGIFILLFALILVRTIQMQHEINRLRESEIQFREQIVRFMETTNSSIEHHNAAIESGTRIMKSLAGLKP